MEKCSGLKVRKSISLNLKIYHNIIHTILCCLFTFTSKMISNSNGFTTEVAEQGKSMKIIILIIEIYYISASDMWNVLRCKHTLCLEHLHNCLIQPLVCTLYAGIAPDQLFVLRSWSITGARLALVEVSLTILKTENRQKTDRHTRVPIESVPD